MVRCPSHRAGFLISFTAIIATVLVQGLSCNLIGQRRNENGNSIVGRPQFRNSFPQIRKSWIVRIFKRAVRMFHCVPFTANAGRCMAEAISRRRMKLNSSKFPLGELKRLIFTFPWLSLFPPRLAKNTQRRDGGLGSKPRSMSFCCVPDRDQLWLT